MEAFGLTLIIGPLLGVIIFAVGCALIEFNKDDDDDDHFAW